MLRQLKFLAIFGLIAGAGYFSGFIKGKDERAFSYSGLPNSCFINSLIHASKANLIIKAEGTASPFATIYGFMFKYNDEIILLGEEKAKIYGHAICIFEFKNKLWAYDDRYGTMYIGEAGPQLMYKEKIGAWVSKAYGVKISDSFVIDDWVLPNLEISAKKD